MIRLVPAGRALLAALALAGCSTGSDRDAAVAAGEELYDDLRAQGVDVLAITDHDTLAAFERIDCRLAGPHLIPGIELSTSWRNIGVHIVGLNIDPASPTLRHGVRQQQRSRAAD